MYFNFIDLRLLRKQVNPRFRYTCDMRDPYQGRC